ncbi:hypothetical protein [Bacillus sp. T33-2]|uniref:hypothetical protein n=1 Tax=Bacillus sp. T33-2 TaxID=2054168 RepID=UPI000C78D714|nr:hypothetical protein [Bacillus sp. T33-2]PLR98904.1 hypothetical protein CVD19_04555 [Bacillus sp. T33-2]
MRFLYRRGSFDDLRKELHDVQNAMASEKFIMVDLFFYALLFALLTYPAGSGYFLFAVIFSIVYLSGASLYLLLRKWLKSGSGFKQ